MAGNEEPKKPINWVKSPHGVFEFYANMAHMTWSVDDVRVRLGQMVNSSETPNPGPGFTAVSEERVAITFSWRNVVLIRDQLNMLIKSYEDTNGPIRVDLKLPPSPD